LTGFDEIWTETVRRTHVTLTETEIIRFTIPGGVAIWVRSIILGVLLPYNDVLHLTVYGMTEDGDQVSYEFPEGDEYPDDISPLISEIIQAGKAASNVPDEVFLTTGDVAREFGVSYGYVAHWDDIGVLKAAFRTVGGHRRFRQEDVARFRMHYRSFRRTDIRTEEITRLREAENLTWKEIGKKFRMTGDAIRRRYYRELNKVG
jgi:DNA-binding transcriptional MerR regulator